MLLFLAPAGILDSETRNPRSCYNRCRDRVVKWSPAMLLGCARKNSNLSCIGFTFCRFPRGRVKQYCNFSPATYQASLAQSVERWSNKPLVMGTIPMESILFVFFFFLTGSGSRGCAEAASIVMCVCFFFYFGGALMQAKSGFKKEKGKEKGEEKDKEKDTAR